MTRFVGLFFGSWLAVAAAAQDLPRRGELGLPLRRATEDARKAAGFTGPEAIEVTADGKGFSAGDLIVAIGPQQPKEFKTMAEWQELVRSVTDKPAAKLRVVRRAKGPAQDVELKIQPKAPDETDKYTTLYDHVVSNGHRIRTFVTRPKAPGKHPVFFWIQGINASTVDFPLTTPNYLCQPIKAFADDGYVTVRVEKPGVGDSEGGPALLVGWDEELDIYRQALKALDKYDFVDRDRVYIFGHSMGGCHAPVVCSEIPVKGIVTWGTVSNSWLEWSVRSPRIQGILAGQTHAQVDQDVRKTTQFYNYLYTEKRTIAWIKENRPELAAFCDEQSPDGVMLGVRSIRYMQEVNDRNYCEYWAKLGKTRVLALFGENDWIALKEDQTQVADAVNAANPGMAEYREVKGMDHIFGKCASMKESFANLGRLPFDPEMVRLIKEWIARTG